MANGVLVLGLSGTGKSSGIRNLDPAKTFIINTDRKPLPIKGWKSKYQTFYNGEKVDAAKSNYVETNSPAMILALMEYVSKNRPEITTIVIDTLGHLMTAEFMRRATEDNWAKYTELALNIYNICNKIPDLRKDLTVFVLSHVETGYDAVDNKVLKIRTIGKLLDEKVDIASLFTIVFVSDMKPNKDGGNDYSFITNGSVPAKSPFEMFKEKTIENDYAKIIEIIKEYEK